MDLKTKQLFWAEQLPLFIERYWLPEHIEVLEFDMEGGCFRIKENIKTDYSEDDLLDIWNRVNTGWAMWKKAVTFMQEKAKAQAVPVWISTDFMLPDEDEAVLFMDKNNVIHDGYLSTDYVDGPYGENGEDFGDNQTLWASNSNGDEFLLNNVKYWMHRPSNPITGGSGAEQ